MASTYSVILGDCREVMASMEAESVNCVVTSPPYWSLRKYDCESAIWGAWRGQYGLEPTPEMYVEHTTEVLRAIRRVLRKDGTVWWNVGDGYASNPAKGNHGPGKEASWLGEWQGRPAPVNGLKPKDLVLMPFRVALAAQADGWWVRSVIVWHKPNAMPESVRDRPTNSHEYILLLTKSARYWWDQGAVREVCQKQGSPGHLKGGNGERAGTRDGLRGASWNVAAGRNMRDVWEFPTQPYPDAHFAVFPIELPTRCIRVGCPPGGLVLDPFAGTGTTIEAAIHEGRRGIGIEASKAYCELAEKRLAEVQAGGLL